jgi:hypothetical protein
MKRAYKNTVLAGNHDDILWLERNLMSRFKSAFLVHLIYAFQTETELFMVMPYLRGEGGFAARSCA